LDNARFEGEVCFPSGSGLTLGTDKMKTKIIILSLLATPLIGLACSSTVELKQQDIQKYPLHGEIEESTNGVSKIYLYFKNEGFFNQVTSVSLKISSPTNSIFLQNDLEIDETVRGIEVSAVNCSMSTELLNIATIKFRIIPKEQIIGPCVLNIEIPLLNLYDEFRVNKYDAQLLSHSPDGKFYKMVYTFEGKAEESETMKRVIAFTDKQYKIPNQKLDPTVKTPVESGDVQGTAGQL